MPPVQPSDYGTRVERLGFGALIGYAATAPFSLLLSQACLDFALLTTILLLCQSPRRLQSRSVRWLAYGACGYLLFSVIAALRSYSPGESLRDCKNLYFLLLPFAGMVLLDPERNRRRFAGVLALSSSIAAAYGVYQYYFVLGANGLATRAHGFFSIYMTYGQFLMMVSAGALAVLFNPGGSTGRRLTATAVWMLTTIAVGLSFVRGAWVGLFAALLVILWMRRKPYLLAVPAGLILLLALSPPTIFGRLVSIVSLRDESNRDRIDLIRAGVRIVRDNPWTGVGQNMVSRVYPLVRVPDSFPRIPPHLHDNFLQIAAERGLPALVFWCLMMAAYVVRAHGEASVGPRSDDRPLFALASLAALTSFVVAGLFDFNFGDSEVAMLALIVMGIPFAGRPISDS